MLLMAKKKKKRVGRESEKKSSFLPGNKSLD